MKLSIVTICKNEETSIAKTIESVVCQSFSDYEYIILDGGSTDKTLDIISKYKDKIIKIISERDSGIWNAMNKGIALSQGEYIYFLNAGDFLYSCNTLKEFFYESDIAEDIVYGDTVEDFGNRQIRKGFSNKITIRYLLGNMISHQSTFTKKSLFEQYGGFDETFRFVSDYDFLWRCVVKRNATYKYIPHPVAIYDMHGLTANPDHRTQLVKEWHRAQRKNLSFFTYYFIHYVNPLLLKGNIFPFKTVSAIFSRMVGLDR